MYNFLVDSTVNVFFIFNFTSSSLSKDLYKIKPPDFKKINISIGNKGGIVAENINHAAINLNAKDNVAPNKISKTNLSLYLVFFAE